MASVTPRANRDGTVSWRVQYRVDGRLRQETFAPTPDDRDGRKAQRAALQFGALVDRVGGAAARAVREARQQRDLGVPTLREWAGTYLDPARGYLAGVTPATAEGYRLAAERSFLVLLGDLPLDAVSPQEVARWVHWQEQQVTARGGTPLSAKTIRNHHAVLSAMLAAAHKAGHVPGNAAKGARITRGVAGEMVLITPAEFEAIYEQLPPWARPLARFLAGTGCRWGEATALTWADINRQADPATARITKAWKRGPGSTPVLGPPKTTKSVRTVSLPAAVVAEMGDGRRPAELVFGSPTGSGQRAWTKRFHEQAWHPAVEGAGIGKRPRVHDLRHAHVSWLVAQGVPLPMIQARLGHEKITTTIDTYGHLSPEAHVQMALLMDQQMGRPLIPEQLELVATLDVATT